jgi:hypothetical protein
MSSRTRSRSRSASGNRKRPATPSVPEIDCNDEHIQGDIRESRLTRFNTIVEKVLDRSQEYKHIVTTPGVLTASLRERYDETATKLKNGLRLAKSVWFNELSDAEKKCRENPAANYATYLQIVKDVTKLKSIWEKRLQVNSAVRRYMATRTARGGYRGKTLKRRRV